jgi:N-acetylmuramoyl-L-alanine amidase
MTGIELALACLALNVYKEARGEPVAGQIAVALVTLNRARQRQKGVCQVILEPYQFSWTITDTRNGRLLPGKAPNQDSPAWWRSFESARLALHVEDFTQGATHFHTPAVSPTWAKKLQYIGQWGNHIFYREK